MKFVIVIVIGFSGRKLPITITTTISMFVRRVIFEAVRVEWQGDGMGRRSSNL